MFLRLYNPQKLTHNQVVFYKWNSLQTEQRQPVENACKLRGKLNSVENKMSHEKAYLGSHSCVYYNVPLLEIQLKSPQQSLQPTGENWQLQDTTADNSIKSICSVLPI